MDLLKRELAPVLPDAWQEIDAEAIRVLRTSLGGRKVVDFSGPYGWEYAAVNLGRLDLRTDGPETGVLAGMRTVQPLVELRAPFHLSIMELDFVARGATNPDLAPVASAAERMAIIEDSAIFCGYEAAGIQGIIPSSPHAPIPVAKPADYPEAILRAQETLLASGIGGPYAVALGPKPYEDLLAATDEGYPVAKRVGRGLIEGPIVRSPALDNAVVVSMRGGDFELIVGVDMAIGYASHDRERVELYLTESFTFRVLEPAAAVPLLPA